MTLSFAITLVLRYLVVMLFLPFSALDKILNFNAAVAQARESIPSDAAARLAIVAALCIEIIIPLGILTGVADRLAAFILAGYCGITALLWKQFWKPGDFWRAGSSRARDLFWDFLKNFSLAGGILLITFGTDAGQVAALLSHPQLSSHPHALRPGHADRGETADSILASMDGCRRRQPSDQMLVDGVRAAIHLQAGAAAVAGSQDQSRGDRDDDGAPGRLDR
jgi:putative oxidoreductase